MRWIWWLAGLLPAMVSVPLATAIQFITQPSINYINLTLALYTNTWKFTLHHVYYIVYIHKHTLLYLIHLFTKLLLQQNSFLSQHDIKQKLFLLKFINFFVWNWNKMWPNFKFMFLHEKSKIEFRSFKSFITFNYIWKKKVCKNQQYNISSRTLLVLKVEKFKSVGKK